MVKSTILGRNSISGRAGSGIVIRRELNAIRNRVRSSLGKRRNPLGYLQSIQNKGAFSQTNTVVDRLIQLYGGNPNLGKGSIRRNFKDLTNNVFESGFRIATQKAKSAKSNIARASAQNVARGIKPSARVTGFTRGGVKYKVSSQGGFERIGFTRDEQARRNRIKTGTATAGDLFRGQNQRTSAGQATIFNRLIRDLQGAERQRLINSQLERRQRLIESQFKIMKKGGLPRATISKEEESKLATSGTFGPATLTQRAQMKLAIIKKEQKRQLAEAQRKGSRSAFKATAVGTLGSFGLGVAKGFVDIGVIVLRPVKTFADVKLFAKSVRKNPKLIITSLQDEANALLVDPAGVLGEYWSFGGALNKVSKVAKRSGLGSFIQKELFIAQQPKVARKAVRLIIDGAEAQRLINPVKPRSIKDLTFYDVKALTRIEAIAVKKAIKRTNSIVFGSKVSSVFSRGKTRFPDDVDIAVPSQARFNKEFLKQLPKDIRVNYNIKKNKKFKTSAIYRGNELIIDLKNINQLFPERSLITRKGFLPVKGKSFRLINKDDLLIPGFRTVDGAFELGTSQVKKISGVKLTGFGEQNLRKAISVIGLIAEKQKNRLKDLPDLLEGLEIQLNTLKKSKSPFTKKKAVKVQKAITLLKSPEFTKLLNRKNKGIFKLYPFLAKITKANHKKFLRSLKLLKRTTKKTAKTVVRKAKSVGKKTKKSLLRSRAKARNATRKAKQAIKKAVTKKRKPVTKEISVRTTPKVAKSRLPPSVQGRLPVPGTKKTIKPSTKTVKKPTKSRLPVSEKRKLTVSDRKKVTKRVTSKKVTKRKVRSKPSGTTRTRRKLTPSRLSKRAESRLSVRKASKTPTRSPSKLTSRVASKPPARVASRSPSRTSSKTPSRTPSRVASRGPSRVPSRLPSRVARKRKPPAKPLRLSRAEDQVKTPFRDAGKNARGYNAWVLANKRWRKANRKPLAKVQANKIGKYVAENSISASYVVVGTLKKATKRKIKLSAPSRNFRPTKSKTKPKGTRVELRGKRINTQGEKRRLKVASVIARARKNRKPKRKKR